MQIPSSIKELFLPLAERLYYYESKEYITTPRTYFDFEGEHSHDSEALIKELGTLVNVFHPKEVLEEATIYSGRIKHIIEQLQYSESELRIDIHYGVTSVLTFNDREGDSTFASDVNKEERKNLLFERHNNELTCYKTGLQNIIEVAEQQLQVKQETQINDEFSDNTKVPFQVPDNLNIKKSKGYFQAAITEKQAALLMNYLRDLAIIPNYSNTDLSRLGTLLFIINQQNIRAGLSRINDLKLEEDDLKSIISILQSVINSISQELPKSK